MKKLSISLFALLTICFAVTSAFTTNNSPKAISYEAWGINLDVVDVSPTPDYDDAYAERKTGTMFHQSSTDFDLTTVYENQLVFECNTADADDLCAAKIKLNNGSPETGTVQQLIAGDYSAF